MIAQRTGKRIRLGDLLKVRIVQVDLVRREMDLAVVGEIGRKGGQSAGKARKDGDKGAKGAKAGKGRKGAKTGAKRPASAADTKRRKGPSRRRRGT